MILRGIVLPSLSLRWPDSITCGNSVLISMTSPFLASVGSLRRGFSAMIFSCFLQLPRSAAAAADGNFHQLLIGEEFAFARLRNRNDILRCGETDARRRRGFAR